MGTSTQHLLLSKYRPDIDGLRAIAVLSVVVFHAFPTLMQGGFVGVDIFFVISGFLISSIIFDNFNRGTFSFAEFYARRAKRIFPGLLLVLAACLIVGWFLLLSDELNQLGKHVLAGVGFVSNFVFWSEAGYFDTSADTKPLLHLWSLGIEEQFYIIWPLLLWLAWKLGFSFLLLAASIAIVSFLFGVSGVWQDPVATFYAPLTRFWELLCGALLAWFSQKKTGSSVSIRSSSGIFVLPGFFKGLESFLPFGPKNLCALCGMLLLGGGFLVINKDASFPGFWALMPVLGAVLIIMAGPEAWFNRKVLSHRILVWFGLISFPLYLWHWPILSFGRIVYFNEPPLNFKVIAVAVSIFLAWLTVKYVERPVRFGGGRSALKVAVLTVLLFFVAVIGLVFYRADFSESHTFENLAIKREGEHAIGSSLAWFQGKEGWLFLGNSYNRSVAKLKLSILPSDLEVRRTADNFEKIAEAAAKENIKLVLIVGPDKPSVYSEYLPDEIGPSPVKYSSFFLERLRGVPNLVVYDPTDDLLSAKRAEGLLYWKTDTHWNEKGAFLAYSGFSNLLGLPVPDVEFIQGTPRRGDLIEISKLKDFPLSTEDNWDVSWRVRPAWSEKEVSNEKKTSFGVISVVTNESALSQKHVWVLGDSFSEALKKYFNASFREVRYIGHWKDKLDDLPSELTGASGSSGK